MELLAWDMQGNLYHDLQIMEVQAVWQCGSPAAALHVEADCIESPPQLLQVQWVIEGMVRFSGLVDSMKVKESVLGVQLVLEARTNGLYLLDNEALPAVYPSISLKAFAEHYFTAYRLFSFGFSPEGYTASYTVRKGMSDWEAISGFVAACCGRRPYLDEQNCLQLLPRKGKQWEVSNKKSGAVWFSSMERKIDRSAVLSKVLVRDAQGYYPTEIKNPQAAELKIRRKRYWIPPSQYEDGRSSPQEMIENSMAEMLRVTVEIPDITEIRIGDTIRLDSGEELSVLAVQLSWDGVYCSKLTLADKSYAYLYG